VSLLTTDIDVVMIDPVVSGLAVFVAESEAYSWITNINVPRFLLELDAAINRGEFSFAGVTDESRHWYRRIA
jgi:hypothetical protein